MIVREALDTNVLLIHQNRADPRHSSVTAALHEATSAGKELCFPAQVMFEFYVVATRPIAVNGLGLSPASASRQVALCREAFSLLPDPPDLIDRWLHLCEERGVSGRPAHDARIVAWMMGQGIRRLITCNPRDFGRFDEIEWSSPA